jgi:hypothetical protein
MGGKSSADASTSTRTVDQRAVSEYGNALTASERSAVRNTSAGTLALSLGDKSKNNAVTVNTSDLGAVNSAFGFAREVARDAFDLSAASQVDVSQTVTDALHSVRDAYTDAYAGAKQGEQKIMTMVGLGVVAMVAVSVLKRG